MEKGVTAPGIQSHRVGGEHETAGPGSPMALEVPPALPGLEVIYFHVESGENAAQRYGLGPTSSGRSKFRTLSPVATS